MSAMMPRGYLPASPVYRGPHTQVIECAPLHGGCPCRRGTKGAPCLEPAGTGGGPCPYCVAEHGERNAT